MWEWITKIIELAEKYPVTASFVLAFLVGVGGGVWKLYTYLKPVPQSGVITLPFTKFEEVIQDRIDKREAQLQNAHAEERARLEEEIADLLQQRANPKKALEEAKAQIKGLIERRQREGDILGAEKLSAALKVLNELDENEFDDYASRVKGINMMSRRPMASEAPEASEEASEASKGNFDWRLRALDKMQEAESMLRETLETYRTKLGNATPDVAASLNNLGALLRKVGQTQEAESMLREALRIQRAKLGNDHPDVAMSLTGLAEALSATGQDQEAEPLALEALAIFKKARPEGHSDIAMVQNLLDDIRARLSRNQSAND